jgi:rfaE bifunctional protein kinase chain/domain
VAALGGQAEAVGVVGDDRAGDALLQELRTCHVETSAIQRLPRGQTWCKTRFTAGDLHTVQQQVMRLDREPHYPDESSWRQALQATLETRLQNATGVLLCDYGGGLFDEGARRLVLALCRKRQLPVVADSRYALQEFQGVTCATPNETEIEPLLGRRLDDDEAVESAGRELQQLLHCPSLIITRGKLGMTVFDGEGSRHLPAFGGDAVDVAGAGDTVSATVVLSLAAGGSVREAARLANYAASQVVLQRGTAVTNRAAVLSCLHGDEALR